MRQMCRKFSEMWLQRNTQKNNPVAQQIIRGPCWGKRDASCDVTAFPYHLGQGIVSNLPKQIEKQIVEERIPRTHSSSWGFCCCSVFWTCFVLFSRQGDYWAKSSGNREGAGNVWGLMEVGESEVNLWDNFRLLTWD